MSRRQNHVFSQAERRAAVYALAIATALAAYGAFLARDLMAPPLGQWSSGFAPAAAPGVIEARPVG